MEKLEEKYIELLLQRCISAKDKDDLLIMLDLKEHISFALKIKEKAHRLGVRNVEIKVFDFDEIHDMLKETAIDGISLDNPKVRPLLDKSILNEFAKKHGAILFIDSNVPDLMNDINPRKIQKRAQESSKTIRYYWDNISSGLFTWSIAAMPNQRWANTVFPNDKNAYEKLYLKIMQACMVDKEDPIKAWDDYFQKSQTVIENLNALQIVRLHYQNNLGTDLYIGMPQRHIWLSADTKNSKGNRTIDNMPSYEIFSSPDFRETNGIVFASKPLIFENRLIEDFYFVFENGKVVEYGAKKGEDLLKQLFGTSFSGKPLQMNKPDYLGEVAFVEYNSPISNTGIIYHSTLFDENSSCHLALGDSFQDAIVGGIEMTKEELLSHGLNQADDHVDFMIGTGDLNITAQTSRGEIPIIEKGNYSKALLKTKKYL